MLTAPLAARTGAATGTFAAGGTFSNLTWLVSACGDGDEGQGQFMKPATERGHSCPPGSADNRWADRNVRAPLNRCGVAARAGADVAQRGPEWSSSVAFASLDGNPRRQAQPSRTEV